MTDWEDLAQRQVAEIQRALPELIRVHATEVPVFFSPARDQKSGPCLGLFQGLSLLEGPPARPVELPRITLSFVTPGRAATSRRAAYPREVRTTHMHE